MFKQEQKKKLKSKIPRNKYILLFRSNVDLGKYNQILHNDKVKCYCIIRAHDIKAARKIAQLYRGDEYLTVAPITEVVQYRMIIHPLIKEVSLDDVDITADYWIINDVGGYTGSMEARLEKTSNKEDMLLQLSKFLISKSLIKNKTQLELWPDRMIENRFLFKIKSEGELYSLIMSKKIPAHSVTDIVQTEN